MPADAGTTARLAEPGILGGMVEPDSNRNERARAVVAVSALAAAIGAFVQAQAAWSAERLAAGWRSPAAGWLDEARVWLPIAVVGLGLSWITSSAPRLRAGLRLLTVGAVAAAAVAVGAGALDAGLADVTAWAIGVVLGLHVGSARRLGAFGVVVAAALAAAVAAAFGAGASATEAGAGALGAVLLALLVDGAGSSETPRAVRGLVRWWRGLGWVVVAGSCVLTASSAPVTLAGAVAGLLALVLAAAASGRLGFAVGAALVAAASLQEAPWTSAGTDRVLARSGDATVVYRRADQEVQLRVGRDVLAAAGPDRDEEPLLLALLHAFVRPGDLVTLLGRGTGRIEPALRAPGRCVVEVVDAWPEAAALAERARVDGPVTPPGGALEGAGVFAAPVASLPTASRQLLAVCELPGAATDHRATTTFQRQLRRVVGSGLTLQPVALDRVAPARLERLLRAARSAHAWNGVYRVGDAVVLVSGAARPVAHVQAAGDDAVRWALHRAHLGGAADVELSFAGELAQLPRLLDPGSSADALLTLSTLAPASGAVGDGQLRWWRSLRAELQRARGQMLVLPDDPAGRGEAAKLAARFLPYGAPRAWLQAALGLVGDDGVALRDPRLQSRCAHALDPTFFPTPPAVFRSLPAPTQQLGDLEDEHRVVPSERLARRCSGENPLAVGLRARFPGACARALVGALAGRALIADEALALRELADPFVLDEAANALLSQGRWAELLMLWRRDLPLPAGLQEATAGLGVEGRRRVAMALRTHLDPSGRGLLAALLLDADLEVRTLAGAALQAAVKDQVPYDPKWSRSRRLDAATRLRALHNRRP